MADVGICKTDARIIPFVLFWATTQPVLFSFVNKVVEQTLGEVAIYLFTYSLFFSKALHLSMNA